MAHESTPTFPESQANEALVMRFRPEKTIYLNDNHFGSEKAARVAIDKLRERKWLCTYGDDTDLLTSFSDQGDGLELLAKFRADFAAVGGKEPSGDKKAAHAAKGKSGLED